MTIHVMSCDCHVMSCDCHVMVIMSCFSHLDLILILNFFPHSFVDLMRQKQEQITIVYNNSPTLFMFAVNFFTELIGVYHLIH